MKEKPKGRIGKITRPRVRRIGKLIPISLVEKYKKKYGCKG
jgi:hypothetical protein